jgi:DNA polymerase IIIc chi subunit
MNKAKDQEQAHALASHLWQARDRSRFDEP